MPLYQQQSSGTGIDEDDVGYDVILLAGQSNMVGVNGVRDDLLDPFDARIWRWVSAGNDVAALADYKGVISLASDPLGHPSSSTGVGPGLSFARWYASITPSNRRILLVPYAVESMPLVTTSGATWNPGVASNLFANAKTLANAAITGAGANARLVAVLWVQGESDALSSETAAAYRTALESLISGLRAGIDTATETTPFVIGSMPPGWAAAGNGTSVAIAATHAATPSRVPYTGYAVGPSDTTDLHYTQSQARTLGRSLFDAYLTAKVSTLTPTVPGQVTGASATGGNGQATIQWTAVTAYPTVTDYLVQYRATGGSTWTTFADGTSTATSATVTGLTNGTGYDFRVAARNSTGDGAWSSTVTATPEDVVETASLFSHASLPAGTVSNVGSAVTVGLAVTSTAAGTVGAVWVPICSGTAGKSLTVGVFADRTSVSPDQQASFTGQATEGWQRVELSSPVSISVDQIFVVALYCSTGDYYAGSGASWPITSGVLTAAADINSRYVTGTGLTNPNLPNTDAILHADPEFTAA